MGREHQTTRQHRQGAMIAGRRVRVAELLVRGHTRYEIHEIMAGEEYINPKTNEPWSLYTLGRDARAVQKQWEKEALLHYDIHVSRILGQIRAVRKRAWESDDMNTVLRTLDQEVKLLGLDKLTKTEIDWKEELRKAGIDPTLTFNDLVQSTYERLLASEEV